MNLLVQSVDASAHFFEVAIVVSIAVGTAKFFEWLDPMLNKKARVAISEWLMNVPHNPGADSWVSVFPNLIDRIFGSRPLSLKFVLRSCIASIIAVTVTSTIYAILFFQKERGGGAFDPEEAAVDLLVFLAIPLLTNFIPDYLSLLVSRMIVRSMAHKPGKMRIAALLLADTVLTGAIALPTAFIAFFIFGYIGEYIVNGLWWGPVQYSSIPDQLRNSLHEFLKFNWLLLNRQTEDSFAGRYFYSSFFTSVWVWLYVVSGALINLASRVGVLWRRISPYLNIKEKPLVAMGRIAGLLLSAMYIVVCGIVWLAGLLRT